MDDIHFVDQNDNITGGLRLSYETNGSISTTMYARSYSQDGLTYANKVFTITSNIQTGISNSRLSTDFVPDTNNTYNLGSPSYQWNNTYTRNILIDNDINIASSLINKTSTSGVISIRGGLNTQDGASIDLYGKDYAGVSNRAGNLYMTAYGNSDYTNLRISPNGTVSVYNNSTDTTKNIAMQEDVIPRSGGVVLTGGTFARNVDNDALLFIGGTAYNLGAYLELNGKNHPTKSGQILLTCRKPNGNAVQLVLYPNGTATWSGSAISTSSDSRLKDEIESIPDEILDAWENLEPKQYKLKSDLETDKENAQVHYGWIAQDVESVIKGNKKGNVKNGLWLHEEWEEQKEISHEETYTEEVETKSGEKQTITKTRKVIDTPYKAKGDSYGLRYTECLVVECAYLRREVSKLKQQNENFEQRLKMLEQSVK